MDPVFFRHEGLFPIPYLPNVNEYKVDAPLSRSARGERINRSKKVSSFSVSNNKRHFSDLFLFQHLQASSRQLRE